LRGVLITENILNGSGQFWTDDWCWGLHCIIMQGTLPGGKLHNMQCFSLPSRAGMPSEYRQNCPLKILYRKWPYINIVSDRCKSYIGSLSRIFIGFLYRISIDFIKDIADIYLTNWNWVVCKVAVHVYRYNTFSHRSTWHTKYCILLFSWVSVSLHYLWHYETQSEKGEHYICPHLTNSSQFVLNWIPIVNYINCEFQITKSNDKPFIKDILWWNNTNTSSKNYIMIDPEGGTRPWSK
jgi:hypothetical protein